MPTAENVLLALKQKKYEEVIALIETNPDFVNLIDPKTGLPLLQTVGIGSDSNEKTRPLIRFIVSHPKFDLTAMSKEDQTNIDEIITSISPDILALVIKTPQILFNKGQLTYLDATKTLTLAEKYHLKAQQKDATSKACASEALMVERSKEMVAMLRDTTISYAIANARADILALMIKEPGILFNKAQQLTYTDAKNALTAAQQIFTVEKAKDPKAKAAVDAGTRVANLTEMVSVLRDATILHALATDDANLFTQLKTAGAAPLDKLGKLGGENYPNLLIKSTNVKLIEWLRITREQTAKQQADKLPHGATPGIMFNNAAAQLEKLQIDKAKAITAAHQTAIEANLANINALKTQLKA